ncbi:MAG TPA: hypothetical protein VHV78_13985 [Gemmatimonadaceae bacterium]|nr:hypothetical protein [Gemmatimonadaceae bacterium]
MRNSTRITLATLLVTALAGTLTAQQPSNGSGDSTKSAAARADSTTKAAPQKISLFRPLEIDHIRPSDQRGLNVFEATKEDQVPFTGFALSIGGAFTQEFQGLSHQNTAQAVMASGVNTNQLIQIGNGFNNAVANLNVNAQIAPGIRVAMTSYLSSRHHQETWVKDGYLLVDASPIDNPLLKTIMQYTTIKAGDFEINYGDAHFRRTDNGNSMFNPFVGNYILDAFTTEIGSEVYLRSNGLIAMLGATGGEIHGEVTTPQARSMSVLGKLGFDEKVADDVRIRLTGSFYANNKSASNTLYTGDRGGSPYFDVLENTTSTETGNAWSGEVHPGFSNKVNAEVVNPFVKVGPAELFGSFETATGGSFAEPKLRTIHQNVYEALYRLFNDKLYVGGRYNTLTGEMITSTYSDQTVARTELGGGWFVTPNVLAKLEWVTSSYSNFPTTDIRNGGQFKGFMVAGAVAF